jgi:hypothetical protein
MDKVFFSHGHIRANRMRFAVVPGGHIRLKDGSLNNGSLIVEGEWHKSKAAVTIYRVEDDHLVKIGRDCEAHKKSAIYDVVKQKLLEMPNKMATFAAELAWRSIMARRALE